MLVYRFSIEDAEGNDREDTGRMVLASDNAARAFGRAIIKDMMLEEDARYAGWTMNVTKGERAVCSIPFARLSAT